MKLAFSIRKIDFYIKKINKSYLDIFKIVIVDYLDKIKIEKI